MDTFAASEKVPEHFKYKWLTHPRESLKDGILDASQVVGLESCNLEPLEPREKEPSLGALGLAPEILRMILTQLSFHDLHNLKAVNTLIRSHVISIPEYQTVKAHAPALLAALWITKLSKHFTLCQIYLLLVTSECTVCGQFGAYVFLLRLQRCCQRCAENEIDFMPITQDAAKKKYGVRNSDMKLLPKLLSMEGTYRASTGELKRYKGKHILFSRAEARRFGNKDPGNEDSVARTDVTYQRNMALLPLPVLFPKEGSVDWGFQCKGCMGAYYKTRTNCNCALVKQGGIEDGEEGWSHAVVVLSKQLAWPCMHYLAADLWYSKEGILEHIGGCEEAKALLGFGISILKHSAPLREVDDVDEFWQLALDRYHDIPSIGVWRAKHPSYL